MGGTQAAAVGSSVIKELQFAERLTAGNDVLTLTMCVNYGGRIELVDAMRSIADDVAAGRLKPSAVSEKLIQRRLYVPDMPDVDLFVRSSGEQRTSNFLLWESAYAEFVFLDTLWPDFSREDLWRRHRRLPRPRPPLRRRRRHPGRLGILSARASTGVSSEPRRPHH